MNRLLKKYIREVLLEILESKDDDLLLEPDENDESEKSEVSAGGVPGAQAPLSGTKSDYNFKKKKKGTKDKK